jgi:hypothetical protein
MVNSEDGKLYRWDLATNTLSEVVTLSSGVGEAYTPTVIGPDGTVYAINAAILNAVGRLAAPTQTPTPRPRGKKTPTPTLTPVLTPTVTPTVTPTRAPKGNKKTPTPTPPP